MTGTLAYTAGRPDGTRSGGVMRRPAPGRITGPLVSCLMVTRGDRTSMAQAIDCYRHQTYANRELVVVCDRPDPLVAPLLAGLADPTIRLVVAPPAPLGTLRNRAVAEARGAMIAQWDDDDLQHPHRLDISVAALAGRVETSASFLMRETLWWPARRRLAVSSRRCWESTMLIRRERLEDYPPLAIGEDFELVRALRGAHPVIAVDAPWAYLYVIHGANTCGEGHFETLFGSASETIEGYEAGLATLGEAMPVAAYRAAIEEAATA